MKQSKNIGIVLSGGGFKGVAHIGALKALKEAGLTPNFISGTSAGAIIGSLYAGDYSIEDIYTFFQNTSIFSLHKFSKKNQGFWILKNSLKICFSSFLKTLLNRYQKNCL